MTQVLTHCLNYSILGTWIEEVLMSRKNIFIVIHQPPPYDFRSLVCPSHMNNVFGKEKIKQLNGFQVPDIKNISDHQGKKNAN